MEGVDEYLQKASSLLLPESPPFSISCGSYTPQPIRVLPRIPDRSLFARFVAPSIFCRPSQVRF